MSRAATSNTIKVLAVTVGVVLTAWLNTTCSTLDAQSALVYPLKVSSNGRYVVGQNDVPFLIVGDSPQGLITDLSTAEAEAYFANRAGYGFNAVQIHLLAQDSFGGRFDYSTYDGITPFTTVGDISTPRESYFARVDTMLNLAAQHGIVVFLTAAETIDSLDLFRSNGVTKSRAFGQYLGNRYESFDNIVWDYGNDFQTWTIASDNAVILAVANGIKDTDSRHLHTAWLDYFVSASRDSPDWDALVDLDFAYTYYPTYALVLAEYARFPAKPVFMGESNYEGDPSVDRLGPPEVIRRQEYWAITSGASGHFYGNHWTWRFLTGWQSHFDTPGAAQTLYFKSLFLSRSWWKLVPDSSHQVLTAGYGTFEEFGISASNDYATAALASDSSFMIAYLPSIRTVTVDMSKLSGPVTAQWYDPSNGYYYTMVGSPFSNTGTRQFTPAGNNSDGDGDWVLVLESPTADVTPPTITNVAVTNTTSTSAVINWTTNEPADSQVSYGVTSSYGSTTPLDTTLETTHTVTLTGLTGATAYHFAVRSKDASGNSAASSDATFSTVNPSNTPPTISSLANQTTSAGVAVGPLAVTVGDVETATASLTLSGSTSNATLVPVGNIAFGGTGSARTVTVTPAAGQTGTATITVTVSDGQAAVPTSFLLTVTATPSGGLVGAWGFNEGTGTTLGDSSGNGRTGTITGATWTTGRYGQALNFDGNDLVTLGDLDLTGAFTVMAWMQTRSLYSGTCGSIVMKAFDYGFELCGGQLAAKVASGSTWSAEVAQTQSSADLSVWKHVALTYDGSTLRFYIGGTLISAAVGTHTTNNTALRFGRWTPASEFWNGLIDEVRMYSRALTQAEIQTNLNTPVGGP